MSEPDRFEEKAKELCLTEWRSIAAALRREREAALDEAARDAETYCPLNASVSALVLAREIAVHIRALASPAAAPAAEMCRAECASRMPDYSHFECTLPKGHTAPHKEGSFAEWTDATTVPAPPSEPAAPEKDPYRVYEEDRAAYRVPEPAPLLPRVLAALEDHGAEYDGKCRSLAAELRAYIAEAKGEGKT